MKLSLRSPRLPKESRVAAARAGAAAVPDPGSAGGQFSVLHDLLDGLPDSLRLACVELWCDSAIWQAPILERLIAIKAAEPVAARPPSVADRLFGRHPTTEDIEAKLAWRAADLTVRNYTATFFESAGRFAYAATLRNLEPIHDQISATHAARWIAPASWELGQMTPQLMDAIERAAHILTHAFHGRGTLTIRMARMLAKEVGPAAPMRLLDELFLTWRETLTPRRRQLSFGRSAVIPS